jgi:hypothetical protein
MATIAIILTVIGTAVVSLLVSLLVATFIYAGSQQRKDWCRYGTHSSRWQIMLEIWNLREIK